MILTNKKHIIAFCLLAFIAFPGCAFIYLQISVLIVRHEMVERLEHSNLQEVTIARKAIRWHEKGKEIIIGNKLFDVESSRIKNDSIIFEGLFDEKETLIKKNVDLLIEHQNKHSSCTSSISQLVFQLWYSIYLEYKIFHPVNALVLKNEWQYKENLLTATHSPLSPPPRQI